MNPQDPSHLVQQPLVNHVHLISGHRFPHLPSLNIDQALRYLIDAPTIVKQTAPMAWLYVQAPQDGTAWLEWISPRNGEYRFASDGYVWGDPEQTFRQDFGGYTIEWMTHNLGFRPNHDQYASHARTRFHFIAKNPGVNAPPPDPSLWIVHYHQANQNHIIPVNQVPIAPQARQIMSERRWLEMQGRLERKDFMLHDREHWPTITVPTNPHMQQAMQHQPGMSPNNPMMQQQMAGGGVPRFPQQQPFAQAQGPPPKRPRHSGPTVVPGSSDGVHDGNVVEEEENQYLDYFDHVTPREISKLRYMQHHYWMEEVFSSPYASSHIVPPDLGLGLMGELKGLTDGILDPPAVDDVTDVKTKPQQAREAQPFTNLKKEQLDEFNRRVEKHLEEGHAEIDKMKREHAEKMAEWKKTKTLMQAEKRLRYATWEGHESAVPVYRLEQPAVNGHGEDLTAHETVEDVVEEVEKMLGVKVRSHDDATMVQKGGLEKEEEPEKDHDMLQGDETDSQTEASHVFQTQQQQQPIMSGANGGMTEALRDSNQQPAISQQPQVQAQVPNISIEMPPSISQVAQSQTPPETNMQQPSALDDLSGQDDLDDMVDMDMGETSLMDMDVDTGDIDFVDHDEDELGEDPTITPARVDEPPVVREEQQEDQQRKPLEERLGERLEERLEEQAELQAELQVGEQAEEREVEREIEREMERGVELPEVTESEQVDEPSKLGSETALGGVEQSTAPEEASAPPLAISSAPSPQNDARETAAVAEEKAIAEIVADAPLEQAPVEDHDTALVISQDPDLQVQAFQAPESDQGGAVDASAPNERGLFDDGTFDDLTDMDGNGDDDGLLDFGGGMGMEESAFGDALHGMDTRTPDVGGGGQEGGGGEA